MSFENRTASIIGGYQFKQFEAFIDLAGMQSWAVMVASSHIHVQRHTHFYNVIPLVQRSTCTLKLLQLRQCLMHLLLQVSSFEGGFFDIVTLKVTAVEVIEGSHQVLSSALEDQEQQLALQYSRVVDIRACENGV